MYYLEHYTNLLILCIVMSGVERMSARKLNECSNIISLRAKTSSSVLKFEVNQLLVVCYDGQMST